jgi:hypothetical protein
MSKEGRKDRKEGRMGGRMEGVVGGRNVSSPENPLGQVGVRTSGG